MHQSSDSIIKEKTSENRRATLPIVLRLSLVLGLICLFVGVAQCQSILFLYGGVTLAAPPGPLILQLSLVNALFWFVF